MKRNCDTSKVERLLGLWSRQCLLWVKPGQGGEIVSLKLTARITRAQTNHGWHSCRNHKKLDVVSNTRRHNAVARKLVDACAIAIDRFARDPIRFLQIRARPKEAWGNPEEPGISHRKWALIIWMKLKDPATNSLAISNQNWLLIGSRQFPGTSPPGTI